MAKLAKAKPLQVEHVKNRASVPQQVVGMQSL
jgi:hypothetical protein